MEPTLLTTAIRTTKEVGRHTRHLLGLRRSENHLQPADLRERFASIYSDGLWQMGDPRTPLSGKGSSIAAAANFAAKLPELLRQLDCKSLLDVGCGDMTWMRSVDVPGYIGVDIVPSVIAVNEKAFPARRFRCLDAVTDPLPNADAALCREVLFHLSFHDAKNLLQNLRRAGISWLFATTDRQTLFNSDIASADFRLLNLRMAPFHFPSPDAAIADDEIAPGRCVAAWHMRDLPL